MPENKKINQTINNTGKNFHPVCLDITICQSHTYRRYIPCLTAVDLRLAVSYLKWRRFLWLVFGEAALDNFNRTIYIRSESSFCVKLRNGMRTEYKGLTISDKLWQK